MQQECRNEDYQSTDYDTHSPEGAYTYANDVLSQTKKKVRPELLAQQKSTGGR
jgi:hypothetical protein